MIARLRSLLTGPWTPADIGKRPYLWLLTLNFFWWKYFLEPASARELALAVLTVVVFVPMYLAGFWRNQQRSILLILLTCLIGVLWAPHNFGAGTFFIFACGMCAGIRQPRHAYAAVAGVLALAVLASATTGPEWFGFLLPALFIGLPTGIGAVM
ncbi:MAG TPA: sensor histidine kinase, partial [Telluria sp.]|nr:sensor histidine kinase [Telluria sp.]